MTVPLAIPLLESGATSADTRAYLARLKRAVIGTSAAKEALLKAGHAERLAALLRSSSHISEETLAVSAEAANVLATMSLPRLTAVDILLSSNVHQAVVLSLSCALHFATVSPTPSPANKYKLLEANLRALKSLYVDLVKVVGPRVWGSNVLGASIDVEERRDAENLWSTLPSAASTVKGKGQEDVDMQGTEGRKLVNLAELKKQADDALRGVFEQASAGLPVTGPGPSSAVSSSPSPLSSVLNLFIDCSLFDGSSSISSQPHRMRLADLVCCFLAGTVRSSAQRAAVMHGGTGKDVLIALRRLAEHASDKVRESALEALSVLIRDSHDAALVLLNLGAGDSYYTRLAPFTTLTRSPVPAIRLGAATLLAVLTKLVHPSTTLPSTEADLGLPTMHVLLGLVEEARELAAGAAFALAYLLADEPELQTRAVTARAFPIFHSVLSKPLLPDQPYQTAAALEEDAHLHEGILLSLASLTALLETPRRLLLDTNLLPHVLSALAHSSVGVRAAGCHCIRALSRSLNLLRTDLVEAHAEEPLVRLLREDENEVVKITASAAVANLLLEFSPMRQALLDAGCLPRMCQLVVKASNPTLRLNAMWAIKNATFQSCADFKRTVLSSLTWDSLALLMSSSVPEISVQALGILRNITCVTNNEPITGLAAVEMGEERMLSVLEAKVAEGPGEMGGEKEDTVVQALYCLNNIATANEAAQLAITSRTMLLRHVLSYLDSRIVALRVAALWVLHNLIYTRGASTFLPPSVPSSSLTSQSRRPHEILDKLRALGLESKLRMLERDPELDVRERVRDLREAMT
ncbi:hypothetical protein JCM11641_000140 [Rhodosporidiobolus odoratus]